MNQKKESQKETVIERMPPQSIEAEIAVLGSMLIDNEAVSKAIEILDETAFYRSAHRKIFQAAVKLFEAQEKVDMLTVSNQLEKMGCLEEVGSAYFLTELVNQVPSAASVEHYAKIVLEKSLLRKLISVSTEIASEAYEAREDAVELIDTAEQKIFSLSERKLRKGFLSIDPILHDTFEIIDGYHKRKGSVTGIPTGFRELDKLTSGFQNSDLIIVAGRPSMGKTAFCLNIARNAAVKHRIPVGVFSLEMSNTQLAMRMLCSEARVDSHKVRTGTLPNNQWSDLSKVVGNLSDAPIYIDDSAALSVLEIRAKARRLKAEKNVGLLIVDYLQLVRDRDFYDFPIFKSACQGIGDSGGGTFAIISCRGIARGRPKTDFIRSSRIRRYRAGRRCGDVYLPPGGLWPGGISRPCRNNHCKATKRAHRYGPTTLS